MPSIRKLKKELSNLVEKYGTLRRCDFTNHPDLYQCTYWGSCQVKVRDNRHEKTYIDDEVIQNRNTFVDVFKIKRKNKIPLCIDDLLDFQKLQHDLDHIEIYYSTDKKYYIISSSYCPTNEAKQQNFAKYGWIQIGSMYQKGLETWMLKIDKLPRTKKDMERYK